MNIGDTVRIKLSAYTDDLGVVGRRGELIAPDTDPEMQGWIVLPRPSDDAGPYGGAPFFLYLNEIEEIPALEQLAEVAE